MNYSMQQIRNFNEDFNSILNLYPERIACEVINGEELIVTYNDLDKLIYFAKNLNLMPLAGISKIKTICCNESGNYAIHKIIIYLQGPTHSSKKKGIQSIENADPHKQKIRKKSYKIQLA